MQCYDYNYKLKLENAIQIIHNMHIIHYFHNLLLLEIQMFMYYVTKERHAFSYHMSGWFNSVFISVFSYMKIYPLHGTYRIECG